MTGLAQRLPHRSRRASGDRDDAEHGCNGGKSDANIVKQDPRVELGGHLLQRDRFGGELSIARKVIGNGHDQDSEDTARGRKP